MRERVVVRGAQSDAADARSIVRVSRIVAGDLDVWERCRCRGVGLMYALTCIASSRRIQAVSVWSPRADVRVSWTKDSLNDILQGH